jgi:thiol-disulfide isomerase/thioredoxin
MEGGRDAKRAKHNRTAKASNSKKPVVLLLHANWCGHCQHLMPEWERMESEIHSPIDPLYGKVEIVKIESADMDTKLPKYKAMVNNKNIPMEGYPTIAMINTGAVKTYGGERSAEKIKNWIATGGGPAQTGGKKRSTKRRVKKTRKTGCKSCKSGSLFSFFK